MGTANPLFLRDEDLDRGLELLMLAERDILIQANEALTRQQLSEAGFRILYLVHRHPGITTSDLGIVLGMTKQSLSRHIKHLIEIGLIEREPNADDRRKRPLHATARAGATIASISFLHRRCLKNAFKSAGPEAVEGFERVLSALIASSGQRMRIGSG